MRPQPHYQLGDKKNKKSDFHTYGIVHQMAETWKFLSHEFEPYYKVADVALVR